MGETSNKQNQDIYKRSYDFSCQLIGFVRGIKVDYVSRIMVTQLVRSGTSISANLYEAKSAETKKDFIHKVSISLKESRETIYWLQILKDSGYVVDNNISGLIDESTEISKILATIKINSQKSVPV